MIITILLIAAIAAIALGVQRHSNSRALATAKAGYARREKAWREYAEVILPAQRAGYSAPGAHVELVSSRPARPMRNAEKV